MAYENDLWTLPRAGRLVRETLARQGQFPGSLATVAPHALESAKARGARRGNATRRRIAGWKEKKWPQLAAKAQAGKRTIVFVF